MQKDHVGAVYELLNEAAIMIKNELQISYIEALAEAGEITAHTPHLHGLFAYCVPPCHEKSSGGSLELFSLLTSLMP